MVGKVLLLRLVYGAAHDRVFRGCGHRLIFIPYVDVFYWVIVPGLAVPDVSTSSVGSRTRPIRLTPRQFLFPLLECIDE